MRKLTLLLVTSILFSSCASILNSKYQKVDIISSTPTNKILINGLEADTKEGKYLFRRDRRPKQITIEREGYKDEHSTIMQYKKSPLHILSWVPFGVLIYPLFYDRGNKSYDYDKEIEMGKNIVAISQRGDEAKKIKLNNVSVNLDAENIRSRYFRTYRNHKRKEEKKEISISDSHEKIEVETTIFPDLLNELLVEKGYIDTTNIALKSNYLTNLLIDASISDYTHHHVSNYHFTEFGGMVYVDLTVEWQALDVYKTPIYSQTTTTRSGQFAILDYDDSDIIVNKAIKDAMEYGLIEFMNSEKIGLLLHDNSAQNLEASFEEILISKPKSYVSNLSQAIDSSITIKNKSGHGSGFVISSEGHIITNYHVVSDLSDLKVVFNNETEYDVQVIRVSKIHDLALLKIDARDIIPFQISDSRDIEIGSDIFAVGTPTAEDLSQTVSKGIISGIRTIDGNAKIIQTDASINSGNSGGAIINKEGLVQGVVSSKLLGYGIEGVAFGIPAYEIYDRLKIRME